MSSQLPPIPEGLNIHASRQSQLYSSTIITYCLAVIAVALRFWSRRLTRTRYFIDDWCVVVALFMATALAINTIIDTKKGLGLHFEILGPDFVTNFFKLLFSAEIFYTLIICFAKFSILGFYWRIFGVDNTIKLPIYILGGVITGWGISVILVSIFQCKPISGFWNRNSPSTCVNNHAFFIGISVPNILTDILLLILPVPYIWKLRRGIAQKAGIAGMFSLGGFVTIISIVRLHALVFASTTSPDLDWNYVYVVIWTTVEANIAIVSACLPSLRPFISYTLTGTSVPGQPLRYPTFKRSGRSYGSNFSLTAGDNSLAGYNNSQRMFVPLHDDAKSLHTNRTVLSSSDIEMQKPAVTRVINLGTS